MKKVLVVDDEPEIVELISMVLEDDLVTVLPAYDGEQGLEIARRERPHLVLTDVMMPRLDGLGLCRQLREDPATRSAVILLMSAIRYIDSSGSGADGLIHKPFDILSLVQTVQTHLGSST
ncbi:MAG: response regulator [Chloroflexota bacterium]|nr:response regulator [Chloroflexota bacterium]